MVVKNGKCQMSSEIVHVERKVSGAKQSRKQVRNGANQQRVFDIVSFTQMGCMFTIKNKKACALHEYESVINFGTKVTLKPSKQKIVKHATTKQKKRNLSNSSPSLSNNNSTCKLSTTPHKDETHSPISTQVSSPFNHSLFNTTCNSISSSTSSSSSSSGSNKIIRTHLPSIHELLNNQQPLNSFSKY